MKRIMSKEEFLVVYERKQFSGLTIKDFCDNEAYSAFLFSLLDRPYNKTPCKVKIHLFL